MPLPHLAPRSFQIGLNLWNGSAATTAPPANTNHRPGFRTPPKKARTPSQAPLGSARRLSGGRATLIATIALALILTIGGGVGLATTLLEPTSRFDAFGVGALAVIPVALLSIVLWLLLAGAGALSTSLVRPFLRR